MDINITLFSAPFFLLLMFMEWCFFYYKKSSVYQLNDTINNLNTGILKEIGSLPLKGLIFFCYYYVYEHFALFSIKPSLLSWILLWIGVDFCYYWYHRSSHRCTLLWIGHSVHHQSESYNLSVALRQGYFQALSSWVFYLPLALLGFPTWMFLIVETLNTIYQFWIHTESIKHMRWFETVFNSPSHHRVHHGQNPQYIDKNYAGSLIIWDKLFGTFEPEDAPVQYGVTEPLDSWNPFYANIKVVKDVLYYGKYLHKKSDVLRAFFRPPEWIIQRLQQQNSNIEKRIPKDKSLQSPKIYMLLNITVAIVLYAYFSFTFTMNSLSAWLIGALIMLTLYALGAASSDKKNIWLVEIIRSVLVLFILILLGKTLILGLICSILFLGVNWCLFHANKIHPNSAPKTLEYEEIK